MKEKNNGRAEDFERDSADMKVGYFETFAYSMGGFGRGLLNTLAGYLNYYCTNCLGLSATIAGNIQLFSRVFDGISDIIVGTLVDKTRSRLGKCRFWMLMSAIPFGIVTWLQFAVPDSTLTVKVAWLAVMYNLITTVFGTIWFVPHSTLLARISTDRKSRQNISIVNQIAFMIACLIPSMFVLPMIVNGGNTPAVWMRVMAIFSPIGVAGMLMSFFFTKERIQDDEVELSRKSVKVKIPMGVMLKTLIRNKYWWLIVGIFIADAMSNNMSFGAQLYYLQYILGDVRYTSQISLMSTGGLIAALFIAPLFLKKMGKRDLFLVGSFIKLAGYLMMAFLPQSVLFFGLGRIVEGFGRGCNYATMYSLIPEIMDYGEWKTGIRLEGMIQSSASFGAKLGVGVGGGLVGILMGMTDFNGLQDIQSDSAIAMISANCLWIPIVFIVIMILFAFMYDLDKRYDSIMGELRTKKERG